MATKKRMLIAGGGYADIPLILAARELGYHVITSGNRPDDLGHRYSDEQKLSDYSDPGSILNIALELKIDAICACCNDFSALSVAYVAEKLGLPGHDPVKTMETIHHKDLYREFAQANGIPSPRAVSCGTKAEALEKIEKLTFPVIIKPVDLTGGKGISIVENSTLLEKKLDHALSVSKVKRLVVEEFMVGSRHGFSAFIRKGKVVFYFTDNEYYYKNPYLVSAASAPGNVSEEAVKKLCRYSEKIAYLLSLKDGIFHVQFILKEDEPIIIEICRRAPGDLYVEFVKLATLVDYPSWIVGAEAGLDSFIIEQVEPKGYYTRHCIMSDTPGTVKEVVYDTSVINCIVDQFLWWEKGHVITDVMTQKLGIVFLKFDNMDEMLTKTENMQELIKVVTEPKK